MRLLVTGIAGDIGFGAGRIIKEFCKTSELHGIDIHDNHAGAKIFDKCAIAPRADSENYINWLNEYISVNCIDLLIPTSEAEISRIAKDGHRELSGAKILIPNDLVVLKSLDKYECLHFLNEKGINVPPNGAFGMEEPIKYPVIIKPRSGQGSKGIKRVENKLEFSSFMKSGFVWQEYLASDEEEYTCPIYRSEKSDLRSIIIRRKLQGGFTSSGEVVESEEITQYIHAIATALNLVGVMNIQLRMTSKGPLLFEINPRLSSTLVFRDKLGFSDLRWWILESLGEMLPPYVKPVSGTRFYRGVQEYIFFK